MPIEANTIRTGALIPGLKAFGVVAIAAFFLASTAACTHSTQGLLLVDDGYTVAQRYENNHAQYPEIEWPELVFQAGQIVEFDLLYKQIGSRQLHIDKFAPPESHSNGKAVILVHGGGWRSGNKAHFYPLANHLAQQGYTVFTPEYRLSTEAPYPAGLIDLNDAIVWVKQHANENHFDPDSVAIAGGSSGGQMVALLAYTADEPLFKSMSGLDTSVMALIDLDGVLDFTTPMALSYENKLKAKSAAGLWLEGSYEQQTDRWNEASAVNHIDSESPPTLIISSGQARFTAGQQEVRQKLDALSIPNEFYAYEGLFHTFWLFEPYVTETADRIDAFLKKTTEPQP